jgi:hypothetical protein
MVVTKMKGMKVEEVLISREQPELEVRKTDEPA